MAKSKSKKKVAKKSKTKKAPARKKKTAKRGAKKKSGKKKSAGGSKPKFKIGDLVRDTSAPRSGEIIAVRGNQIRVFQDDGSTIWWDVRPSVKRKRPKSALDMTIVGQDSLTPRASRPKVDFDDEQAVLREVLMVLGEEDMLDQMNIEEYGHMFTRVKAYEISTGGTHGREWIVMRDDDEAEDEAKARVKQDLEESPEIFNQGFIESHIDMDALKKYVYDDRMQDDYVDEEAHNARDFWRLAEQYRVSTSQWENDEGELPDEVPDDAIEEVKEAYAKDAAADPMQFFEDIYGDEAMKYAIQAAGIDIDEAADEAIRADGFAHFMNTYDGNYQETPSGFVVFRTN